MSHIIRILLFLTLIGALSSIYTSCVVPGRSTLDSTGRDRDEDRGRDEDEDRERSANLRKCHERDSCEDVCDSIFELTSERLECGELPGSDVSRISVVDDILTDDSIGSRDLEDLELEDFSLYLDIGFDSFVELLAGEEVGDDGFGWGDDRDTDAERERIRRNNSLVLLEWIAENEDVAELFLEQDTHSTAAIQLFVNISKNESIGNLNNDDNATFSGDTFTITVRDDEGRTTYRDNDIEVDNFDEFIMGFALPYNNFSRFQFMIFASDGGNIDAFEWAHKALLENCSAAMDEGEEDVETKQCMLAAYCAFSDSGSQSTNSNQNTIFNELDDQNDIIGRTGDNTRDCSRIYDEDRVEDLF